LLAQGQAGEAERWTEERGLTENDEVSYVRERDHLVLARVLLARSEPGRALGLLERLDELPESQARNGSLIQIRAVRSLALHSAGDQQVALTVLADALARGAPEGFVRVFVDEGPPMAALFDGCWRGDARSTRRPPPPRVSRPPGPSLRAAGLPIRPPTSRGGGVAGRRHRRLLVPGGWTATSCLPA
jgi:hypothetical protein